MKLHVENNCPDEVKPNRYETQNTRFPDIKEIAKKLMHTQSKKYKENRTQVQQYHIWKM